MKSQIVKGITILRIFCFRWAVKDNKCCFINIKKNELVNTKRMSEMSRAHRAKNRVNVGDDGVRKKLSILRICKKILVFDGLLADITTSLWHDQYKQSH